MRAAGAFFPRLGLWACYLASARAARGGPCDSQLFQAGARPGSPRARQQGPPETCFWAAGPRRDGGGSSRESECKRDCVERGRVCPFDEGGSCSCAPELFPPRGGGELATGVSPRSSAEAGAAGMLGLKRVRFVAQRAASPRECLGNLTRNSTYTVLLVFAGRRSYIHMLLHYLDELVRQCSVHEVHVWDYARDREDARWLHGAAKNRSGAEWQLMSHAVEGRGWADVYEFYASPEAGAARPRWQPLSEMAGRDNTVLVKADDDIVYIDVSSFDSYVDFIRSHREKFVVHANVVNNGVAAYYQARHIRELADRIRGLDEYPSWQGRLGEFGWLLDGSGRAADLHKYFLRHHENFSWTEGDGCIVYGREQAARTGQAGQGRFSINFFGARWSEWNHVRRLALDPEGDEVGITTRGSAEGREQCIFTAFNVAHFSFRVQSVAWDVYTAYERLLASA